MTSKISAIISTLMNGGGGGLRKSLTRKDLRKNKSGRSCRIEELEPREMLSANILGFDVFQGPQDDLDFDHYGSFVETGIVSAEDVAVPASAIAASNAVAAAPQQSECNANDWEKYSAAMSENKLQDRMIVWSRVGGESRITGIQANSWDLRSGESQITGDLDLSGCTALMKVELSGNQLTSLNVSGCTALMQLDCYDNKLGSLDVSECTRLQYLDCAGNKLAALNVSDCKYLTTLWCDSNQLTSLDLSNNADLIDLWCDNNQLTVLDVSKCIYLAELWCNNNKLTGLDVSKCIYLTDLECVNNQLTALDVSKNTSLQNFWCGKNQLEALDVSNNTKLTYLDCTSNKLNSLTLSVNASFLEYWSWTDRWYDDEDRRWYTDREEGYDCFIEYGGNPSSMTIDVDITPLLNGSTSFGIGATLDLANIPLIRAKIWGKNSYKSTYKETTYKWYYADGTLIPTSLYKDAKGKFTFGGLKEGDQIYCTIENKHYAAGSSPMKTTTITIGAGELHADKLITAPAGTGYVAFVKGVKAQTAKQSPDTTVSSVAVLWKPDATNDANTAQVFIDVYAPAPKGKGAIAPLVNTVTLTIKDDGTAEAVDKNGDAVKVTGNRSTGFTIVITGLQAGIKYSLEMQAKEKGENGKLSQMKKFAASTVKYTAVTKNGKITPDVGSVAFAWNKSAISDVADTVRTYVIGLYDTKGKAFSVTFDGAEGYNPILGIGWKITGTSIKITGLASQKYTFGVQEVLKDKEGNELARSQISTFSGSPAKYAAPAVTAPKKNDDTLFWTEKQPAAGQLITYTLGLYSPKAKAFVGDSWATNDYAVSGQKENLYDVWPDEEDDGGDWYKFSERETSRSYSCTEVVKFGVQEVLRDAATGRVIAKSAIKMVTVTHKFTEYDYD